MENIDRIIHHPIFKMSMKKIGECEKNREFCCHGISHSLDVARIAYIVNLEQHLGISKEMIYGAALLHDIGRWRQYEEDIPHEEAGAAWRQIFWRIHLLAGMRSGRFSRQ